MRYKTAQLTPRIKKLAKAFQKASEASHNYTMKYQRENPTIRDLKKELKRAGHPEKLRRQVVRTTKGYARAKKLVARESRPNPLPREKWIPAKIKVGPGGTVQVVVKR